MIVQAPSSSASGLWCSRKFGPTRFKLQYRAEFYNALNHSNYYVQTSQADAGFFGTGVPFQILGKKGVNPAVGVPNERRFIQMALRLTF